MLVGVLHEHLRLAGHAALLFAVGLFASWPVVHYRVRTLAWLPLQVLRLVGRALGEEPSLARVTAVIFAFNGSAMLFYMASGVHPLLPKVFAVWTGMNVGIAMGVAQREDLGAFGRAGAGQCVPPRWLTTACGVLVPVLELPCFWLSVGMGIGLGHAARGGAHAYLAALGERVAAYGAFVLPVLLASAVAESVAVRGMAAQAPFDEAGEPRASA